MKTGVRLAAIVLIGVVAAGCAESRPSTRALEKQLVATGLSAGTAKCVVDGMYDKFGAARLGAREEPTRAEIAVQKVLVARCKLAAK